MDGIISSFVLVLHFPDGFILRKFSVTLYFSRWLEGQFRCLSYNLLWHDSQFGCSAIFYEIAIDI